MIKHPLKKLSLYFLRHSLTANGKRIVFLVTTYLKLTERDTPCKEELQRLNRALHLARTEDALLFPTRLTNLVWQQEILEDAVCRECEMGTCQVLHHQTTISMAMRACRAIVDSAPRWLRYGRRDDMYRDLVALVTLTRDPLPAAA